MPRSHRLLLASLGVALSLAAPASAQPDDEAMLTAFEAQGFSAAAVQAFLGTEAEAVALLGEPSGETMVPGEFEVDPSRRGLVFALAGGSTLTLALCSDEDRRTYDVAPERAFCLADWERPAESEAAAWEAASGARAGLRAAAPLTFGECDTTYHSFGSLLAVVGVGEDRRSLVISLTPPYATSP